VISLKRFKLNSKQKIARSGQSGDKLRTKVKFPIENFNLQRHVLSSNGQPIIYDLFAVSNHYGEAAMGHYIAIAKNPKD